MWWPGAMRARVAETTVATWRLVHGWLQSQAMTKPPHGTGPLLGARAAGAFVSSDGRVCLSSKEMDI
jgi:hypothetical protein